MGVPGPGWLFCPADRPERYAKAAAAADVVILDLEGAVSPDAKADARQALADTLQDVERTVIRVNAAETEDLARDLKILAALPYRRVMRAKTETREQVEKLADHEVIALIESPLGAVNAVEIAQARATSSGSCGVRRLSTAALGDDAAAPPTSPITPSCIRLAARCC